MKKSEIVKLEIAKAMKPTLGDRIVGVFSPSKALQRQQMRGAAALVSGYTGARYDKPSLRTFFTSVASPDVDTIYDLKTLRGRSRDLVRNTPIATGAVETMVGNVIGTGLTLNYTPDAEILEMTDEQRDAFRQQVTREWELWCESTDADITRQTNFYGLQDLVFRSTLESGDCFALLPFVDRGVSSRSPYQLVVQIVEADRVDNSGSGATQLGVAQAPLEGLTQGQAKAGTKQTAGVVTDQNGAPVEYIIADQHPGDVPFTGQQNWRRVPAFGPKTGRRNVCHVFRRLRPGQTRGVPFLAPIIESLKQLDRYAEAEIMAAVISAMFTVFVKTKTGEGIAPTGYADDAASSDGVAPTKLVGNPKKEMGLGNGAMVELLPDEDVEFADPKRPNSSFDPFVSSVLRQIGVALGLPYEVLIKHFEASYSASRAALLEAWRTFKQRRAFMALNFCDPVFEAWFEEAAALGTIDAPGFFDDPRLRRAYLSCEWTGDAPSQIDPVKEVQAAQIRTEIGISTLEDETMSLTGRNWDDVQKQRAKEKKLRVAAGLEAPITAQVLPKTAKGEGLQTPTKQDPEDPTTGPVDGGPQQ